ncbi:type IV pili methyl-accepting chemotaxis transducer N-terminal domain-containing protein [Paucibacter sp. APW11]|uniref:Sensor protein n=1 Tax=Roseateles aquae TaxID=3077235 RepID=A0ABU3P657_9BURK|nr:type IV pili methyl-accepting chemotaxis transducer N-terminal domain-containing protein [Paucibacter sp. APW11]MDT8998056.1 type IV pili methyl-accepting chemotaxis transducer N-terminal domain-containing protein [Paucibacter sp. APW11]
MLRRISSLVGKLALIQTSFMVLALASIGATLWVSWQLEGGAGAINEAGRMRMLSYRMTVAHAEGRQSDLLKDAETFDAMVERLRVGDPERPLFLPDTEACHRYFERVAQGWPALRKRLLEPAGVRVSPLTDAFVAHIDELVGAIEHEIASRTAILGGLCFGLVLLVVAASVVFVAGTYNWIVQPLQRLREGLQRMAAGELGARVDELGSVDEFKSLAQGFNQMAAALQQAYQGLEDRVREKTAHLAQQNERLEALYDVALLAAEADVSLESMAQSFAHKLARLVRADASAVRLAAQDGERWLLLGQTCLPQEMIDAERCLRQGDCACGSADAEGGRTRIIPIHSIAGPRLKHCEMAGYQTVLAIPMRTSGRTIGEVELFFYGERRLADSEEQLLDALVGQFALQVDNLRLVARDREMAVSEERNLLAQELHDSIAQVLAFLKIQVQLLRAAIGRARPDEVERTVAEIETGVKECYANVRELLVHFRTRPGHEDIEHALRSALAKFEHQSGLSTQLSVHGDGLPLPPDHQVQVLHIIQEALSNVRKHAEADHVRVRVEQLPRWSFEVQDNGLGFEAPSSERAQTHVGLQIMRERAQRIGAQLSIERPPEGGTLVRLVLPQADAMRAGATSAAALTLETQ